jgi:hypothetical protein
MNKFIFGFAFVLTLSACNKTNEANADNFTKSMNAYLAKRGDLCFDYSWPVDVTLAEFPYNSRNAIQMPVLEKLGLVHSSDAIKTIPIDDSNETRSVAAKRYQLTETGLKDYRAHNVVSSIIPGAKPIDRKDLCVATLTLDKIVKWEELPAVSGNRQVEVSYTYHVKSVPWMQDADARHVFQLADRVIQGDGKTEMKEAFVMTKDGWVAKDLLHFQ